MKIMSASKEVVKELIEKRKGKVLVINICAERDLEYNQIKEYVDDNGGEKPELGCLYVPRNYGIDNMKLYLLAITNSSVYVPATFRYLVHTMSLEDWEVTDDGDRKEIDTVVIKFMKKYDIKQEVALDAVYTAADHFHNKTIVFCERDEKKTILPFKKRK